MPRVVEGSLSAAGMSFSIIVSRFNDFITSHLLDGAVGALLRHGASDDQITVFCTSACAAIADAANKRRPGARCSGSSMADTYCCHAP